MTRRFTVLSLTMLFAVSANAQQFKMQKWNIGGDGGTDYVMADPATGRVFVSRQTHVMVVDGATGKVLGDIPDTPRMHGIGLAPKANHGFVTNAGDSTLTIFDLKTLATIKKVPVKVGGLDGIMYDESTDRIILTNHSRPGTAQAVDPNTGDITGTAELADNGPEGAASDGKGRLFVNLEGKNAIQIVDQKTWKAGATWPICEGPTGIAYDKASNRIFAGCGNKSSVVDAATGKVVAEITNGDRVDALGWDPVQKLIYIPSGAGKGTVTVVHQDSPDKYTVVATVETFPGAKTITVDSKTHTAYLFQPEFGPPPAGAPAGPGGRPARGPVVAGWFISITH